MQARGSVYLHKNMRFPNGGMADKYLVLLNTPSKKEPYLFVKTTSQQKNKPKNSGCIKKFGLYYISPGETLFPKHTWIQLYPIFEIQPNRINNNPDVKKVGDLDHKKIDDIVNCLFLTHDIDILPSHRKLLRPPIEEGILKLAEKYRKDRC